MEFNESVDFLRICLGPLGTRKVGKSPSNLAMWTRQIPSTSSTPAKYASSMARVGSRTRDRIVSINAIERRYSVSAAEGSSISS